MDEGNNGCLIIIYRCLFWKFRYLEIPNQVTLKKNLHFQQPFANLMNISTKFGLISLFFVNDILDIYCPAFLGCLLCSGMLLNLLREHTHMLCLDFYISVFLRLFPSSLCTDLMIPYWTLHTLICWTMLVKSLVYCLFLPD